MSDPQQDRNVEALASECPNCGQPDGQHHNLCQQEAVWELQESVNQLEEKINEMNSRPSQPPQNVEAVSARDRELMEAAKQNWDSFKAGDAANGMGEEIEQLKTACDLIRVVRRKFEHDGNCYCDYCQAWSQLGLIADRMQKANGGFDRLRLALSAKGAVAAFIDRLDVDEMAKVLMRWGSPHAGNSKAYRDGAENIVSSLRLALSATSPHGEKGTGDEEYWKAQAEYARSEVRRLHEKQALKDAVVLWPTR